MTSSELLLTQLRALHAQAMGIAHTIEAILVVAEADADATATVAPGCEHPMMSRVGMAVMGHPNRFFCQKCEQEVEG